MSTIVKLVLEAERASRVEASEEALRQALRQSLQRSRQEQERVRAGSGVLPVLTRLAPSATTLRAGLSCMWWGAPGQ